MFCASLLLRAPVLVIFVTVTRLLWPTPFNSRYSIQSFFAGEGVGTSSLRKKSNALANAKTSSTTGSSTSSTHNDTSAAAPALDEYFRLDNLDLYRSQYLAAKRSASSSSGQIQPSATYYWRAMAMIPSSRSFKWHGCTRGIWSYTSNPSICF